MILIDPNTNQSRQIYDAGNRLIQNYNRLNGITRYQYDSQDQITQVIAPNGVTTTYTYDLLSRRLSESSPDRGTITYQYDLADNLIAQTDARGIQTLYEYDELERLTTQTLPNSLSTPEHPLDETVQYHYDNCPLGTGRICRRDDQSGSWVYQYDSFGNITQTLHTELGIEYRTHYVYDLADRIIEMTLPSGRQIEYPRDEVGRVRQINTELNKEPQGQVPNCEFLTCKTEP